LLPGTHSLWFSLKIFLDIHNLFKALGLVAYATFQLLVTIQPTAKRDSVLYTGYFPEKVEMNEIVAQSGSIWGSNFCAPYSKGFGDIKLSSP